MTNSNTQPALPGTKPRIMVLHHGDADGFGAAYALWKAFNDTAEMKFIPVQYSEAAPLEEIRDFDPHNLFVVDFCYSGDELKMLDEKFPNTHLKVIDHHKTAARHLEEWGGDFIFDTEEAGCMLTWKHLFDVESFRIPEILIYVADRDLWKFEQERSKEVNAFISTLPFDFQVWEDFYLPDAVTAGSAILEFQKRQINGRLKAVELHNFQLVENCETFTHYWLLGCMLLNSAETVLASYQVPMVNATENISELGEAMCLEYPEAPFSVSYCDRKGGKRSFSLRSHFGFDVSEVAKAFGGGGHPAAAGFTTDSPGIFNV